MNHWTSSGRFFMYYEDIDGDTGSNDVPARKGLCLVSIAIMPRFLLVIHDEAW